MWDLNGLGFEIEGLGFRVWGLGFVRATLHPPLAPVPLEFLESDTRLAACG